MSNRVLSSCPSEFDEFLQATIAEEHNGTPLTVLSALVRLDLDPWEEAASLARLPQELAARRVAAMINSLSGTRPPAECDLIALRVLDNLH
jgi:hypothetical protein